MSSVLDRFLRYVTYDTQSDETSDTYPSTSRQLVLLRDLAAELQALGLADAAVDRFGYVTATVPATSSKPQTPVIGFIAHVDTSPEMSGTGVKPIVHRGYDGRDLVLPDDPSAVLRLADCPALAEQIGHDIVTASGTTLLGADNKAGVAEIVTAAAHLIAHPEIPHGPIRIAFTPDEEIGRGTKFFDVERFGARCAYTMDGGSRGEVETESFSADAVTVTFHGFNTHPGYGKGRLINAIKVAADFIHLLPRDTLSPETTGGRDGFVHPYIVNAGVDTTSVKLIVRDFETAGLKDKELLIEHLAREAAADFPGARARSRRRGAVSEHAGGPRSPSRSGRARARSGEARRPGGPRAPDPGRHGRLAAVVHGIADAEYFRGGAEFPLATGVGVGPGHGKGDRGDRPPLSHLGRTVRLKPDS